MLKPSFKLILVAGLLLVRLFAFCQAEQELVIPVKGTELKGTLLVPSKFETLVIIIAGSGPTDRDGNSGFTKNNSLRLLAESLNGNKIASFRYDKRVLNGLDSLQILNLRFEDFINDAQACVNYFDSLFPSKIIVVLGHSQGATIASIVGQSEKVDKVIMVAGPGRNIADVLIDQLSVQLPAYTNEITQSVDSLRNGHLISTYPPFLEGMFKNVQPFLIGWMKYNPLDEVKKLKKPLLILQGSTDLQVTLEDAKSIHKANENSILAVIEGMNHVLKEAPMDRAKNMATYSKPDLPIKKECLKELKKFLK